MKNIILITCFFVLFSCENDNPAFRFSNYYNTEAENIAKAIKENDVKTIRQEIVKKNVNINFKDDNYEIPLITLALANNKREAFEELLKLGANSNVSSSYCVSPLISAIRYNKDCDLFYVKKLLNSGAKINPRFFDKCNDFTHDPIVETILHYNDEDKISCGLEILKILTTKLDNPNLLFQYNNPDDFHENIVYNCINTNKNLSALKYLIIDLKYKVPKEIYIDGTVLLNYDGYKNLKEILQSKEFNLEKSDFRKEAKNEILKYLNENNGSE